MDAELQPFSGGPHPAKNNVRQLIDRRLPITGPTFSTQVDPPFPTPIRYNNFCNTKFEIWAVLGNLLE